MAATDGAVCLCVCCKLWKFLNFRHPRCVGSSEVKDELVSKHNWFIGWVLMKQHVSAYWETVIRVRVLAVRH